MFKLIKYEFRKNLVSLLVILGIVALLQGWFLIEYMLQDDNIFIPVLLLFVSGLMSFVMIFILAVSAYSKELSHKSIYLIFMTPNSTLSIILSKLLYSLIVGAIIFGTYGVLGFIDIQLLSGNALEIMDLWQIAKIILTASGYNVGSLILSVLSTIIYFIVNFLSSVTIAYLAITLSATLLQNSKGRGILSVVFYLLFIGVLSRITSAITFFVADEVVLETFSDVLLMQLPVFIIQLIVVIGCVLACAKLLKEKISL